MTGNFNIRDRKWDPEYPFHSVYSNLLSNITDTFDLSFSHSTNTVPTRYLNNSSNLMLLRPNSLELDNHLILSEL